MTNRRLGPRSRATFRTRRCGVQTAPQQADNKGSSLLIQGSCLANFRVACTLHALLLHCFKTSSVTGQSSMSRTDQLRAAVDVWCSCYYMRPQQQLPCINAQLAAMHATLPVLLHQHLCMQQYTRHHLLLLTIRGSAALQSSATACRAVAQLVHATALQPAHFIQPAYQRN